MPVKKVYPKKKSFSIRKYARKAVRYGVAALSSRYGTYRKPNLTNLVSDVMLLKQAINAEKKRWTYPYHVNQPVGQVNVNADTAFSAIDVTPIPPSGSGASQRTGSSIKLSGLQARFQIQSQANLSTNLKGKIYIIQSTGDTLVINNTNVNKFLTPDPISGLTDYNSTRSPDFYKQFRVIAERSFFLKQDDISGQKVLVNMTMNVSFKYVKDAHVRYQVDSTTIAAGQLFCLIVTDTGNIDSVNPSTLANIANTATLTGCIVNSYFKYFYYDN